ncbi:MAG: cell wall hydrolase [Lachnospiraceae bacterium]|nr:cell wall hydrolase [Lachnospiraceae bacterium]
MRKGIFGESKKLRLLSIILVLGLTGSTAINSYATEETKKKLEEAKEQREESKEELADTKEDITDMTQQKNSLQAELSNLNDELEKVSDNLADIEVQIDDKEAEIEQTQADLAEAIALEEEQYAAMKKRIQFIYERQNFVMFEIFLHSQSFADFLNQKDYIESLSEYDRKMLEQYKETKLYIQEKEAALEIEKVELDSYQTDVEEEQSRVSGLVNKTSSNISKYSEDILEAEAQAQELEEDIASQDVDIKLLEAKLAEEIRLSKLAAQSKWRNISEITFAEGDRNLLANLIYCEAGSEPYAGKVAVGAVVINRVLSSVYPDTVVGVIYQSGQFSPVASGRLATALAKGSATSDCFSAADEAMAGNTNVGNCVYFRTPIPGLSGINIGGHVFY